MGQTGADVESKRADRRPGAATGERKPQAAAGAGPSIIKATKTRKLVAAGTADEVEIAQELDEREKSGKSDDDSTEA